MQAIKYIQFNATGWLDFFLSYFFPETQLAS